MSLRERLRRRIRLASANLRKDMPRTWVVQDAAEMAREADILCLQEIRKAWNLRAVQQGLGPAWRIKHAHLPIPIAWRRAKFKLIDSGWQKLHDGASWVPNPSRFVCWVVLRRRFLPWSKPFVVVNTHWPNAAFSGEQPHQDWRQEKWWVDYEKCQDRVIRFLIKGFTVFLAGDLNKLKVDPFSPEWDWHWNRGICKVGGYQGGQPYRVPAARSVHLNSDHPGIVLDVVLEKP